MKLGIPAGVTAKLKNLKPLDIAAKTVGAIGVGAVLYDAHNWAKLKAYENKNTKNANAGLDYFNNTQYLDNQSHITTKMKKALFNWEISSTIRGAWNATTGYIGGFASNLGGSIIPLAASAAAIALSGKKALIATGALGVYAAGSAIRHVCSHFDHKP